MFDDFDLDIQKTGAAVDLEPFTWTQSYMSLCATQCNNMCGNPSVEPCGGGGATHTCSQAMDSFCVCNTARQCF